MLPDTFSRNQELHNFSTLTWLELSLNDTKNQSEMTKSSERCMQSTEMLDTCTGSHSLPHGGHRHINTAQTASSCSLLWLSRTVRMWIQQLSLDPSLSRDVGTGCRRYKTSQTQTTLRQPLRALTQTWHLPLSWRPPVPAIFPAAGTPLGPQESSSLNPVKKKKELEMNMIRRQVRLS